MTGQLTMFIAIDTVVAVLSAVLPFTLPIPTNAALTMVATHLMAR